MTATPERQSEPSIRLRGNTRVFVAEFEPPLDLDSAQIFEATVQGCPILKMEPDETGGVPLIKYERKIYGVQAEEVEQEFARRYVTIAQSLGKVIAGNQRRTAAASEKVAAA